jgi:hypothetical protein
MLRIILLIVIAASSAFSQTTGTASVLGAATDSTGSVVADAKVTVINTGTQFVSNTVTTGEGTYYVPYLNPGTYRITIEAAGFKKYVRDGVVLRTDETPRIDVQLEVGSVSESINVTGGAPLLETETSASGQIIEGETIVKIPVPEKNLVRLTLYMPGMNVINGQHAMGQRERALGMIQDGISGKEPARNAFYTPSPGTAGSTPSMIQTLDMVQEVKLWTTGLPAEFGHSSGGLMSTVFKSGTNQFHGSLEDRITLPKLVNRSYFEVLGIDYTYHEATGTVGGPVYLPKIYNGKNRTFFFFGVQRHDGEIFESVTSAVPSQAMLNGDFTFGGRGFPIFDPASTRQDASGRYIRDPFPGNQVPQGRFDPVARNLINLHPWKQANVPGILTPTGPDQNLTVSRFGGYYFTRYDTKIDHQFNASHRIFGRYSQLRERSPGRESAELTARLFDSSISIPIDMRNIVLSDTYTLNPTTINELRIGFSRRHSTRLPESYGKNFAQQLGMPNVSAETFPQFAPTLNPGAFPTSFYNLAPGGKNQDVAQGLTLQNNLTKVIGQHTFKIGYEMIRTSFNALAETLPSGVYSMGGTDNPFTPNTGNDFAALLLGSVVKATFTQPVATWLPRWWSHAAYFQDDYKPLRKLTFNLGLRWSYESPFQTKYGQQSEFDPTARDPVSGLVGAISHSKGALAKRDLNNFEPRLGLAWNFKPKWVFRSSFGLMHSDLFTNASNQNFEEYLATANVQPPPGDPRVAFQLSQGPPSFKFNVGPDGSVPFVGTNFSARTASWFDPNMRMPYILNWSGAVQWQMSATWLLELNYQGSSGVGLLNAWDSNVVPLDVSRDPVQLERIRQQYQNFKPYPQFGSILAYSNFGHSTYHGGTIRVEKRYSSGLTINSFYTFSKSIDSADDDGVATGITYYNQRLEKGRAGYDVNHRNVTTLTYELPYGRGKRFGNRRGVSNAVLGGWEMVYSQTIQTGPPFTVTFAGSPNRYLPGASRPIQALPNDQVKLAHVDIGPNRIPSSAQNRYLKLNGFQYPDNFTPGTLGRNTLTGPGIYWSQVSLAKYWLFRERAKLGIRLDVNNPTKYQSFGLPNSAFNSTNPANFGTFNSVRGSLSDIGTARRNGIIVVRLDW